MCVAAMAIDHDPRWPLVVLANRDEAHGRASDPLAAWPDHPHILAGRDQVSGGAWLGVSTHGRLALVTNLRGYGAPDPAAASRGALVAEFLLGGGSTAVEQVNPANLITIDGMDAEVATNRPAARRQRMPAGLHGLSNGPMDEPQAKVLELNAALAHALVDFDGDLEPFFAALRSEAAAAAEGSPSAAVFVRNPSYGTRCSTIVAVRRDGAGVIAERRFDAAGAATGDTVLDFTWPRGGDGAPSQAR